MNEKFKVKRLLVESNTLVGGQSETDEPLPSVISALIVPTLWNTFALLYVREAVSTLDAPPASSRGLLSPSNLRLPAHAFGFSSSFLLLSVSPFRLPFYSLLSIRILENKRYTFDWSYLG